LKPIGSAAETSVLATAHPSLRFRWFQRCEILLRYQTHWRYVCAIQIGSAHVSSDDQDTAAQVAALKVAAQIARSLARG
jgi:hypothetical protein